ncbi:mitochondrial carrier domain-containing protein [Phyllosticta citricarpa]
MGVHNTEIHLNAPDTNPDTAKEALAGQGMEALKDITFGSLAGIAGKYIEYPFDTVKVRLQSQPEHLPLRYTGPLDCFKKSWAKDGVMGLYRGISAPLVGAAVENASLFFSYRLCQEALQKHVLGPATPVPFSGLLLCGAVSGAFTSMLLTPIELVKCKMQVPLETSSGQVRRMGPLGVMANVYRHQGIAGFWHGQMGTLIRETGGSAAWFGGYEGMALFFRGLREKSGSSKSKDDPLPIHQQMACGAMAGMSYNFLFYPADTIKSRMQTEDVTRLSGVKRTFGSVGKLIYQQSGLKGLYRGCGITVARSAPSSAFIFTIYETLKQQCWSNRFEDVDLTWRHCKSHGRDSATTCTWGKRRLAILETQADRPREQDAAERIVLDPKYKEILTLLKGLRNGIVYGGKVRFPHALVMIFLFRSGDFRTKLSMVLKATKTHAKNLGTFALIYKTSMLALRHLSPTGKERQYDSLLAGLAGGYYVFGRGVQSSVNQQIVIYVFARVVLAYAKLLVQPKPASSAGASSGTGGWGLIKDEKLAATLRERSWPVFASLSWALVMYVFRWHPEAVQPSMRSSMVYIYDQADRWDSLRNFIWHNK